MEPGVPFALLGAVVLLAVAAWAGLGAVALVRSRGSRAAAWVLAVGAAVLAGVEVVTATSFGSADSEVLPVVRAAGLLLLAGGLYAGALALRPAPSPALAQPPALAVGVVVPLAAGPAPALIAGLAGLAAVLAALRSRRDALGLGMAAGLLLAALSAGLAPLAVDADGALAVVLLRGASALLLLTVLVVLARSSVLGKVVAAILAGVLVMAVAAVGVVGTVVANAALAEQASLVEDASLGRQERIVQSVAAAQADAPFVAEACGRDPARCDQVFNALAGPAQPTFAATIPAAGTPLSIGGRAPLGAGELLALAGSPLVRLALAGGPNRVPPAGIASVVRLVGAQPGLAVVALVPGARPTPQDPATSVFAYGIRLDDTFARADTDAGGFGLSLLVGDQVVASNLTGRARAQVEQIADRAGVTAGVGAAGRTVDAQSTSPAVSFRTLSGLDGQPAGTIALSRDAIVSLDAQQSALRALLLTAVAATAVVAGLALLLGRRTVEPLRRLTSAAERVAAGDLGVTTGLTGRDEVGTLSRSFDAMTGSVSQLTGDLRATAGRLGTVLASMTDGLVATDAHGRVTSINRAALAMAGTTAEQAHGRLLDDVVDLRVGGSPFCLQATTVDVAADVHRPDASIVPVRVAVAPLDGGEGLVLVLRDTTREREVERMKTEFLSNVSHELRTPLTPIRGYAEILVSRPGLPSDRVTSFATTIRDESIKMNRVVDLLVDVAAIEAGRVTVTPRAISPGELVDARLADWRERRPDRADDLRRRVAARLPEVHVDPVWVGKALDELIDNALKHTPAGTVVTLVASTCDDPERVRVAVRDAGPGIAASDQESLFLSFEQVDGSATRRVGGLGLGLSFVRRLAQDAGFPLTVTSARGKGAEFALDLPVAEMQPARGPAPRGRATR